MLSLRYKYEKSLNSANNMEWNVRSDTSTTCTHSSDMSDSYASAVSAIVLNGAQGHVRSVATKPYCFVRVKF